jgi:hypothetical protein
VKDLTVNKIGLKYDADAVVWIQPAVDGGQ